MRALLRRLPFAATITLAIVLKLILLFALYKAFFSTPQVKKMRMPTARIEQHLLDTPAAATAPAAALASSTMSAPPATSSTPPSKDHP